VALVFPGQGSQFPGMCTGLAREFPACRSILDRADALLGYSLTGIMNGDHGEELNRTVHTQPAVFVHSMALWEVLRDRSDLIPRVSAGHSLGEYSALCAAGLLTFEDALETVRVRAEAMDLSQPPGTCGMAAVIGVDRAEVAAAVESCRGDDVLEAANFNAPDQVVASGHLTALHRLMDAIKTHRRSRTVLLPVSSAFHTSLMQPASQSLQQQLAKVTTGEAVFPVMSNVTAQRHSSSGHDIKQLLTEQVVRPVLWEDCVRSMLAMGAETFVEIGPGKVLTGLLKRIDRTARAISVSDPESLRSFEKGCV
jgi:[acyl-carrier-protein] S-malonyltransferase